MRARISGVTLVVLSAALAAALSGCAAAPNTSVRPEPQPAPPQESPAAGTRLAPGLYDLADGTAQAIGTLEYIDLEGGLWAIIGGTQAEGTAGTFVAVIANPDQFAQELSSLQGRQVSVLGTKLEGVSYRMAGPEIEATSIDEISDTPGAAE